MIPAMLTQIIRAVTSGKVATNRMQKQMVVISTVFGIFTDFRQSTRREKPL
jgi:hypothetical protein